MQRNWFPIVAAANAALVFAPGAVWAQASSQSDRYGPHMMSWGAGWYGMGPLLMIVGLAVAIALVRVFGGVQGSFPPPNKTALDFLKERYVRGEIDKDEYEQRRGILRD